MRTHSFATEYRVARRLALEAGQAILKSSQDGRGKPIASAAPVACRAASTMILQGIRRDFPADASLTSTTVDRPERVANERVWIIDPLDEAVGAVAEGREFALAIGLAVASTPVVGIVYLPRRRVLYGAAWGAGAWIEQQGTTRSLNVRAPTETRPRPLIPNRGDLPILSSILEDLQLDEPVTCESTGLACSMLLDGVADLYIDPSPSLRDWHCCAPDIILREAGATVTDCYGEPLSYNRRVPVQRQGFICCGPGMLESVLPSVTPRFAAAHAPKVSRLDVRTQPTLHLIGVPFPPISTIGRDT